MRLSIVPRLCEPSVPYAIIWAVTSVVVLPFECQLFWALAHVAEKILKLEPPLTNFDSATAVAVPVYAVFVGTPFYHPLPNLIGPRLALSVGCSYGRCGFYSQAPAAACQVAGEGRSGDYFFYAAIANAVPHGVSVLAFTSVVQDADTAKPLTSDVFNAGANNLGRHARLLYR